jgi:hypothetical protein
MEDYVGVVTKNLVNGLVNGFIQECMAGSNSSFDPTESIREKLEAAPGIFMEIVTKREFPEFLITYLNDTYIFWSFQRHRGVSRVWQAGHMPWVPLAGGFWFVWVSTF